MDTHKLLSRRQVLKAAPIAAAAVAIPSAVASAEAGPNPEQGGDRLSRLMEEISEILDDALFGKFCAIIEPSKHERSMVALKPIRDVRAAFSTTAFLKNAPHQALVEYHMTGLAKAFQKEHGGCWIARAERDHSITISPLPHEADGIWVSFPVEGL